MFIADLLVALMIGFCFVWIATVTFGTKGPWNSFLWFFVVVALFAWAGGIWLVPFGPTWMGIGWAPILFMGFLAVLLLTSASPRKSPNPLAPKDQAESEKLKSQMAANREEWIAVDLFFWVLVICLLVFGSSHYIWYPRVN